MTATQTLSRGTSSRPRAWQQGDRVTIKLSMASRPQYVAAKNLPGAVTFSDGEAYAHVAFDHPSYPDGLLVKDIPFAYLIPAAPEAKRKGVLNLHEPKDERKEDERLDDGCEWLTSHGYDVLRVGQSRESAVCHCCSRNARARGENRFVRIKCSVCGGPGFSPSTNSTKGTPDTFVFHDEWPESEFLGIEWKDAWNGTRTPEQKELERRKRITVVWNTFTLLTAVVAKERRLGRNPHPDALEYLERHTPRTTTEEATTHA
jgi:hypothetical protein